MKKEKVVEIHIFEKPEDIREFCGCAKTARLEIIASLEDSHCYVYACPDESCMEEAAERAVRLLFRSPVPMLSSSPEERIGEGHTLITKYEVEALY